MGLVNRANPAQAQIIWASLSRPSVRRVATKMRQAGIPISHQTIHRWRRKGWRPLDREQEHPLDAARRLLDDAVPLLTGDPTTTAKVLVQQASAEREKLEKLADAELLRQAARALAVDVTVVGDAFLRQPQVIIQKPRELANLFRALTACAEAASAAFIQAAESKPGIEAVDPT
jgi:hypothetical protein